MPCMCLDFLCGCIQVTNYQLQKQRESDAKARASTAEEDAAAKKRVVSEDAYAALVEVGCHTVYTTARRLTEAETWQTAVVALLLSQPVPGCLPAGSEKRTVLSQSSCKNLVG